MIQSAQGVDAPVPFPGDNSAGSLLVVFVGKPASISNGSAIITFSDSQVNTYVPLPVRSNVPATCWEQTFYCLSAKAGPNTVTATMTDGILTPQTGVIVAVHEFPAGLAFDATSFATGTGLSQDSGGIATAFPDELLFGSEMAGTTSGQTSVTSEASWTLAESFAGAGLTQYKIVTSTGTYHSLTTATTGKGGSVDWAAKIIGFNAPLVAVPRSSIIEF